MALRIISFFCAISSFYYPAFSAPAPFPSSLNKRAELDDWIAEQNRASLTGLLANIGSAGAKSYGASTGLVLASPSKVNPDYFYTWTRDSALVFKALVDQFIASGDSYLQIEINDYISAQAKLQTISNPSGGLDDGAGLGEPKYLPNGTAFTGDWGRPQRDGPALRATALIAYGRWLLDNDYRSAVTDIVWPIVKNDLAYVAQYWNQTGFDLWEEVNGSSFFTTAAQYRALVEGSSFAQSIGQSCLDCNSQAPQVLCFLQTYWNGEHVVSNINTNIDRSGKDVNSILASIHIYDSEAGCDDLSFQPCSPRMLANHKVVTDSFRSIYSINEGIDPSSAVAVGRYPEDVYYNGNPWYLTTLAASQQLHSGLHQLQKASSITITPLSLPFWLSIHPSATLGVFPSTSTPFSTLTTSLKTYADAYLSIVQSYTPPSGALAEQFDRDTGVPVSAADLTWSYASFLTAAAARNGIVPASWGAGNVTGIPDVCSASSVPGSYTPAADTAWPDFPCTPAANVTLTFNILAATSVGEEIFVAGSAAVLGAWDVGGAVKLDSGMYLEGEPLWVGSVVVGPGESVGYKYFRSDVGGGVIWEEGEDRVVVVDEGCRRAAAVGDQWR